MPGLFMIILPLIEMLIVYCEEGRLNMSASTIKITIRITGRLYDEEGSGMPLLG